MNSNFAVDDTGLFKQKVLSWLKQFDTFCFLDSNHYVAHHELLIGAGCARTYKSSESNALQEFQSFLDEKKSWVFGHLGYELVTSDHINRSVKDDPLQFPDILFFEPEIIIALKNNNILISASDPEDVFNSINTIVVKAPILQQSISINSKIDKNEYMAIINQLKHHIHRGDCYEINFCQEFFSENIIIDPVSLFEQLSAISPNPFSGLYRTGDKWLICASPERYIKKNDDRIITQPIKGTLIRDRFSSDIFSEQKELLYSIKDRAENVMIVDLVRNDLSKLCTEGSVKVDELFGIYTFPQVHQMVSTVSGTLKPEINFSDIISATFPMGSMTGAPKMRVMELIDQYEKSKRGIFSGALGYIAPGGDFDFNVVIRSIMYNQSTAYLSFQTGGGITTYSNPQSEWEECMLKAKAIKKILEG